MPDDLPAPAPESIPDVPPFPDTADDAATLPGQSPPKPPRPRSQRGKKAIEDLDFRSRQEDLEEKQKENKRRHAEFRQLLWFRWVLGLVALAVVVWWQFRILSITERQGTKELDIPVQVLLALITTTTVNVFGFLLIVYRFVFPPPAPVG